MTATRNRVFTRSRLMWFGGVLLLITPLMLATYRDGGELTSDATLTALGVAALIAAGTALLFGKGKT